MPSLMLLALTALIWEGSIDFADSASLTQWEISFQFRLVSKTWDPGTSRQRPVGPLVLCYRDLAAQPVEDDRPAASRSRVYGHHVLRQTCHLRVSGLTTVSSGSPFRYRSTCFATIMAPLVVVSKVAPPMWGMTMVLSISMSGLTGLDGS